MYVIMCKQNGEDNKLIKDDIIKYNWGKDFDKTVFFQTKQDAINFIKTEPLFCKINNNKKPFLLSDINLDSVYIRKIEEIKYKNISKISFNKLLKELKENI